MTFYSNPKRDYVLNPRGKALYDDSNRFGTKMLEKMGWSKGKGLGANLDGQLEFIKVSHKGDQKGVGFKDRDDQWTTHESNFNSLLTSFQSAENSDESESEAVQRFQSTDKSAKSKKDENEKEAVFSGVSLEERSKNSRARVHYKKFTRGKDLARYSEKDLANIFGKKSLKCEPETESSTRESNEDENLDKSSENTPNFGITTIETGTTINDYFKNKMKQIANGSKTSSNEEDTNVEAVVSSNKKEKKRNKKSKSSEISVQCPETGDNNQGTSEETAVEEHPPLSGKRKHDFDSAEGSKSRKKKKSINETVEALDVEEEAPKKPKKRRGEKVPNSSEVETVQTDKPMESTSETITKADCATVNENEIRRTKKSKKSKGGDAEESQSSSKSINDNLDSESAEPKNKSKKNRENKQIESCSDTPTAGDQQSTNLFEVVSNIIDERTAPEVVTDNVYEIRRYRTEIFRFVDLHAFPNSTLCDIPGYGYTNEMTLKIVDKGDDNRLINTLWNDALDKYASGKKKKKKFVEHIEGLKKKNVFKI
ncbi:PIN2/TERF1-interacting telomerase inhibitor 1 [Bradysia coprophila]|uniref:PIN2/TERF1-interacting telomerase inhibitor 1 n=1 Tax=Bradysia coprophila TaxID=38358 RepID=UPI00187D7A2E|nr:PIN2/TERF1-interacting telomerase inhibitor 1 [Bradysia coprophila]